MSIHSFYCRYMMLIIIQHLCHRIGSDEIAARVHKAMDKEKSWTFAKSTKSSKIINNILLSYYYHILRHSFGFDILSYKYAYDMNHNFYKTRKKIKGSCLCCRTTCNKCCNLYCIGTVQKS